MLACHHQGPFLMLATQHFCDLSLLPGGSQPHLHPHPLDHPVLCPAVVWPAAAECHAAAASGEGELRLAPEGAERHQREEEVPEGAADPAGPGPAPARQVPWLTQLPSLRGGGRARVM